MPRIPVPGQSGGNGGGGAPPADPAVWAKPRVEPAASEACRYLCAGVHMDGEYRAKVLDELYVHEERFTAPSFGIDAARVLAHALHARRLELAWGLGFLLFWVVSTLLTGWLFILLALPCLLLAMGKALTRRTGETAQASAARTLGSTALRWYGRILLAIVLLVLLGTAFGDPGGESPREALDGLPGADLFTPLTDSGTGSGGDTEKRDAWLTLFLFLVPLPVAVGLQRGQFARLMRGPLSAQHFPNAAADPAEGPMGRRADRTKQQIRQEQHAPLIMYHTDNPFRGAGGAFDTWTLAVELRPREDASPRPVDNRTILDTIHGLVDNLKIPAGGHSSPEQAEGVRDRLRELHVDECVFMPAEGVPGRYGVAYDPASFAVLSAAAVEEGGESRRHFLRIRVGGWHEELVVTVFVRVHTQGGMLMLEIAPHVLPPVDRKFCDADRMAHDYAQAGPFGKVFSALTASPSAAALNLAALVRWIGSTKELLTSDKRRALPDGPAVSVREAGTGPEVSLFQEMDVLRYLRSIQDRVTDGVKVSLYEAGWRTAEFEQKVVNVSGGTYIDSAHNSAFTFGANSTATTNNTAGTGGTGGTGTTSNAGANHGSS
ncbi:hypothetical protein [Streptomyces sp. Z26]|uniref:hypothetical protein n=1 Tax=Streptomyces sp. Z26 TaxID=2500177 RepID=UPI001F0C6C92|nr:hypothetical protein [Streptomyces sp. Z26]